eukprot:scpid100576/ scgid2631/ 
MHAQLHLSGIRRPSAPCPNHTAAYRSANTLLVLPVTVRDNNTIWSVVHGGALETTVIMVGLACTMITMALIFPMHTNAWSNVPASYHAFSVYCASLESVWQLEDQECIVRPWKVFGRWRTRTCIVHPWKVFGRWRTRTQAKTTRPRWV